MVGRRAKKPQVSGALAKVLLERDDGCGWCLGECESSEASIEYRNPAPKDSDASIDSDDLIAVCQLCQQTEKRSVRFPRGLLVAADKIEGPGFSETVRVALIEYLESRTAALEEEYFEKKLIGFKRDYDFLLKTPSMEAGIEVKKSWEDASKYYKMSAMILKSFQTLQKKIDDELEQHQFLVLEREKEGE